MFRQTACVFFLFTLLAQAAEPRKIAVLVGVNKYQHPELNKPKPLDYAEADVTDFGAELEKSGYEVHKLLGSAATAATIDAKLKQLTRADGGEVAILIVALAGHGLQLEGDHDAYYCPYDTQFTVKDKKSLPDISTCVSFETILAHLKSSPAKSRAFFADACRNDPNSGRGRGVGTRISTKDLPENTAMLLSCKDGQRAWEHKTWGHGAFFYHVLEGFRGAAKDNRDRVTSLSLFNYLDDQVSDAVANVIKGGVEQNPIPLITGKVDFLIRAGNESLPKVLSSRVTGAEFVLIPAGKFMMGSPDGEGLDDERPQHEVRITKPFYLGKTEVTQKQWEAVMGTTPWAGKENVKEGPDYPATYVSWDDAVAYCKKLSEKEGRAYRLPTEAEWEYACRAGSTGKYTFGDSESELLEYAWIDKNAWDVGDKYAHEVGLKRANRWGLHDMHGNVWEWCSDYYDGKFYGSAQSWENPVVPDNRPNRVLRGGSWHDAPAYARSAYRLRDDPARRYNFLGFRVAFQFRPDK